MKGKAKIRVWATVVCCVTCMAGSLDAVTFDATWNGGAGSWTSPGNWSTTDFPDNFFDNYNVFIDGGKTGADSIVTLENAGVFVDSLAIDSGDELRIVNSETNDDLALAAVTIERVPGNPDSGMFLNHGQITMESGDFPSFLFFSGHTTLSGTGSVVMGNSLNNVITTEHTVITQSAEHTIRGSGELLLNNGGLINHGTVTADQFNLLAIDPDDSGVDNHGTMQAVDGGFMLIVDAGVSNLGSLHATGLLSQLTIVESEVTNTGGTIGAHDGGVVELADGAWITGGTLESTTQGVFIIDTRGNPPDPNPVVLNDVTVAPGTVVTHSDFDFGVQWADEGSSQKAIVTGTLTNNGVWALNSTGGMNKHILGLEGDTVLTGFGEIVMSGDPDHNLIRTDGSQLITHGSDHTIRGTGTLRFGASREEGGIIVHDSTFLNQGTMIAEAGDVLTVRAGFTSSTGPLFINEGTLQATGGGHLILRDGQFTNENGGRVIVDTTLTLTNGATFTNESGEGGAPDGIVSGSGVIDIIDGTFTNNATVAPGGSIGVLTIQGDYTQGVDGRLSIELADHASPEGPREDPGEDPGAGAGPGAGEAFDQLIIIDVATLAGTLHINLIDGFIPSRGDVFTPLIAGQIIDDFTDYSGDIFRLGISNVALVPLVKLGLTEEDPDSVTLIATAPGDTDGNGIVDFFDFLTLQNHFELPGDWFDGDFDGNKSVDFLDFLLLQNNFEAGTPQQLQAIAEFASLNAPEPGTLAALLLGLPWCVGRRLRKV